MSETPASGTWEPVQRQRASRFLDFANPGDSVEGIYLGRKPVTIRDVSEFRHILDLGEDGEKILPAHLDLNEWLSGIKAGTPVRITYQGEKPLKGGKRMKLYSVLQPKAAGAASDDQEVPF